MLSNMTVGQLLSYAPIIITMAILSKNSKSNLNQDYYYTC